MAAYRCPGCDYVYNESNGAVREGLWESTRGGNPVGRPSAGLGLPGLRRTRKARLRNSGGNEMSDYKLFVCVQCGFEYDEAKGWPEDGIAPGTRWDDIPEDWSCPDCGAAKSDFEMVEVARS